MNASGKTAAPAWTSSGAIAQWFAGKSLEEMDVAEFREKRLYPDSLKRKGMSNDEVQEVKVRIRPPTSRDKALARMDALVWARNLAGEKWNKLPDRFTIADAEAYLGPMYFDELDTKCLVARCTHEHKAPHDQFLLPEMLDANYDHASIIDLWERINFWNDQQDPRIQELTKEDFLQTVAAIDRVRNVSPLTAIAGYARDSFIVSMAVQLRSFLTQQSSSPSTANSTPNGAETS